MIKTITKINNLITLNHTEFFMNKFNFSTMFLFTVTISSYTFCADSAHNAVSDTKESLTMQIENIDKRLAELRYQQSESEIVLLDLELQNCPILTEANMEHKGFIEKDNKKPLDRLDKLFTRNSQSSEYHIGLLKNNYPNLLKKLNTIQDTVIYLDQNKNKHLKTTFNFLPDYSIIKENNKYFIITSHTFNLNPEYVNIKESLNKNDEKLTTCIVQKSSPIYENNKNAPIEAIIGGKREITPQTIDSVLKKDPFLKINSHFMPVKLEIDKGHIINLIAGIQTLESSSVFNRYKSLKTHKK